MKRFLMLLTFSAMLAALAIAQPRMADKTTSTAAPDVFEARYEGGLFGASQKENGTLTFDDINERVIFNRQGKEMFSIPYASLLMIYPDSKKDVAQAGKVISHLPLPGAGLASLWNKDTRYANLTFDDPDIHARGTASFRFKEKEKLLAFINRLGSKAKLTQRGDAFYKPKATSTY